MSAAHRDQTRWLMGAALLLAVLAVTVWSCTRPNAAYCDRDDPACPAGKGCNLQRHECMDLGLDGGAGEDCAPGACPATAPICDPSTGQCRSCGDESECTALDDRAPICTDDGRCAECGRSSDCPAGAPTCAGGTCVACEAEGGGDAVCSGRGAGTPYCAAGACVECRDPAHCADESAPVCGAEGSCRGCREHAECATSVCTPSGACAATEDIVHVDGDAGADGSDCGGPGAPCATLSGTDGALSHVDAGREYVLVREASAYAEEIVLDGARVTLVVEGGATLAPSTPNPVLTASGGAEVTLAGGRLAQVATTDVDGLSCQNADVTLEGVTVTGFGRSAISAGTDCALTVRGSEIEGSAETQITADGARVDIASSVVAGGRREGIDVEDGALTLRRSTVRGNHGGGVSITASDFSLVNNVIVENGSASGTATSLYGGVRVENTASREQVFAFNTVAENQADPDRDAFGVDCFAQGLEASSSIVYGGFGPDAAVSGTCGWSYSNVQGADALELGATNLDVAPGFVEGGYHLQASSACVDGADPDADLDVDIDGDSRPAGERSDIGADEIAPGARPARSTR